MTDDQGDGRPPFVPAYSRPDKPGLSMNFDNTVSMLHVVQKEDGFTDAVRDCLALVNKSQETYPDWPRVFFLEIEGHRDEERGFDEDFVEFQQEFFFSTIANFVTAFELPLTGGLINPNPQRNDVPDEIVVQDKR